MSEIAGISIAREPDVWPSAVMDLRVHSGLPSEIISVWEDRLADAQCVVTARDTLNNGLVGMGVVMGDTQTAELAHVAVRLDRNKHRLNKSIGQEMLRFVQETGVERVMFACQPDVFERDKPAVTRRTREKIRDAGFVRAEAPNTWVKTLAPEV